MYKKSIKNIWSCRKKVVSLHRQTKKNNNEQKQQKK